MEYEGEMQIICQEKERLDQALKVKNNQLIESSNTISNYEYELESFRRRVNGLEARAQEANELN